MSEVDAFLDFIDDLRAANGGESDRALSLRTTGSPDTIRDVRRKKLLPGRIKLIRMADALHVTVDQLLGRPPPSDDAPLAVEATPAALGDVTRAFRSGGKGLPVVGTALGHDMSFDDNGSPEIEVTLLEPTEVMHYVARPPALIGNDDAYAFYVQGDSMFPAHKPGALRVANPRVGIGIHDDVVVQLRAPIDDGQAGHEVVSVLIKTLVRWDPLESTCRHASLSIL